MNTYSSVLTEALDNILEFGFDSSGRLSYWASRLKEAAESSLASEGEMEKKLRAALTQVYQRSITNSAALARHPGLPSRTLSRFAPQLRNELDQRIMSVANLIRLNREEAINRTIRRFAGFASAIPPGGAAISGRAQKKVEIRKALSQLPFEERRVIIDQSNKLASALNQLIAREGGAIAACWHSNWRQPGYAYRDDHKERDLIFYGIRECEAVEKGWINRGGGFTDSITAPAQEPFCRCHYVYYYGLNQLPANMLTAKGRKELESANDRVSVSFR